MRTVFAALCLATIALADPRTFSFEAPGEAEVILELNLASPGSDWSVVGREAAVASIRVAGKPDHHAIAFAGEARYTYRLFLGRFSSGTHQVTIDRDDQRSAKGARLSVLGAKFVVVTPQNSDFRQLANAPILFARRNTIGRFSDVPLLLYGERLGNDLQYTAIFSNEDGGTSTRALMARWGRTTDIEYIYRLSPTQAIVQGPNHRDIEFKGVREAEHPLLVPVTDNNMVAEPQAEASDPGQLRFQLAPKNVDLANASREQVMDEDPVTYQVMAKEMVREGKFRAYGRVDGEKISDLRNYLFLEFKGSYRDGGYSVDVQLKDNKVYSSDLGRVDLAISRPGWVRTTIELPPGAKRSDVLGIAFRCTQTGRERSLVPSAECTLHKVNKAFFLREDYLPGPSFWSFAQETVVPSGQSIVGRP
jgi:hypothetical protein